MAVCADLVSSKASCGDHQQSLKVVLSKSDKKKFYQ